MKTRGVHVIVLMTIFGGLFCLLTACQPHTSLALNNEEPLRYKNWWNFYERGITRLNKGDTQAAIEDLECALGIRKGAKFGYSIDQRRARTYGLHFLNDYFPNRETGIAFYGLGDYLNAKKYLEISLKQTPSGRAKHYLNLVRRVLVKNKDRRAPFIHIEQEAGRKWTGLRRRNMRGTAKDDYFVRKIYIDNKPLFVELAEQELEFQRNIPLKQGTNTIRISATDLAENSSTEEVTWIADWQPPELVITGLEKERTSWILDGFIYDDYLLAGIQVNGKSLLLPDTQPGTTNSKAVHFVLNGREELLIRAEDMAGNEFKTILSGRDLEQYAASGYNQLASSVDTMADAGGVTLPARAPDRMKPSLNISDYAKTKIIYDEEYYIDGHAADGSGLDGIQINGEELLLRAHHGAKYRYFARRIPLNEGTNFLTITATDLAGNTNTKDLTVIRKQPEHLCSDYRLTMGVTPLVYSDAIPDPTAEIIKMSLETELLQDPIRFHLLERDEGWDFIMQEQNLSLSDLADPKAALRIGKMLPAEMLLMGSIISYKGGTTIFAKIVETENGRILYEDDVYTEGEHNELTYQLGGLVMKIEQYFPLLEGHITQLNNDRVTLDIGADDGVRLRTRFVVMQKGNSMETIYKAGSIPVELDVRKARHNSCIAAILPKEGKKLIKSGDAVYAR